MTDKEKTDFECDFCGNKWNLISHDWDRDRCSNCGKMVSRNNKGKRTQ